MLVSLKQRGDTIVEVMIAIVIISFVLAGGYLISNQSLLDERQAQERAEALELVEAQLESLRSATSSGSLVLSTPQAQPFCMVNGTAETPSAANDECTFSSADTPSPATTIPSYTTQITYSNFNPGGSAPFPYDITVQAVWAQLGGGNENVLLNYRIYGN